jgi:hypothetical protein
MERGLVLSVLVSVREELFVGGPAKVSDTGKA